jgi:hypothetical protein
MGEMPPPSRSGTPRAYARTPDINRTIRAARANGIDVQALELLSDGTIRLFSQSPAPNDDAKREYDRWAEAGRL